MSRRLPLRREDVLGRSFAALLELWRGLEPDEAASKFVEQPRAVQLAAVSGLARRGPEAIRAITRYIAHLEGELERLERELRDAKEES